MAAAGLEVRIDAAGNLVGRLAGADPEAGTLLLGSHLDTVRDAGAFDGPLGVLTAVACVERLRAEGTRLPFAIDVAGLQRRGGRCATAPPTWAAARWPGASSPRCSTSSTTTASRWAPRCGLRAAPGDVARASRQGERLLGYCEVHIEQGPVLEGRDAPVGVVSAIAGATRAELEFTGRAGHAGTVPMDARHDAACAAAEWVLAVEATARREPGLVATVGRLQARPGRRTSSPARRSPRSTCATPTTRRATRRWRPCATRRSASAPRAASRSRGASCMSAPAVAMRRRARRRCWPRRWPTQGCR